MQQPRHANHEHIHGQQCGHMAIMHEGHVDYLHDGHLHSPQGDHYDEHTIAVSKANPATCAPLACTYDHEAEGHEKVPHGNHLDYLCDGQLHHRHGDHCDNHGPLVLH
jgi:hypothetical protein